MKVCDWEPAPLPPPMADADVHVWRARLDLADHAVARLGALLTSDECARANRYVLQRDRRRAVVARGTLRQLLSGYVRKPLSELRFVLGSHGKPHLAGGEIEFSLAHSEELMVLAVAHRRALGVDVECHRHDLHVEGIARKAFSPREIGSLAALPEAARLDAFYACWTRKEAYIKAIGLGLTMPLDAFSVTLAPWETPAIVEVPSDPAEATRWSLYSFRPASCFSGAIAVLGVGALLHFFDLAVQD